MKRQIGPVTCVHSYGQLDALRSKKGEKTFENLQDFAYIDQDEWKSNNLEGRSKGSNEASEKSQDCQTRLT